VDGRTLRFRHAMIATGVAPLLPSLPGSRIAAPLTSDNLWDVRALPRRLLVLGGGPKGVELGQAFARLGAPVTLVQQADRLLPREEPVASQVIEAALTAEGVEVHVGSRALRIETGERGRYLVVDDGGQPRQLPFAALLVAVGRRPRTEGLGVELAGVALDGRGAVVVDDRLRTTNPRIYAGGDVTMRLPYTHTAFAHGATVVQNALFGLRHSVDHDRIPWVTFTDPEVARVGLSVGQARERFGTRMRVRVAPHGALDRAVTAAATTGSATLVGDPSGRLVGATIIGPRAGETIGEVVAWMAGGATLSTIVRSATHAYPTWSQDLEAASLEELRSGLARLRPASSMFMGARRLLLR
jgi:pyruvate/2-oxoglutarate dehydrogenase complex dihydrolipoamide dehydrogenase (E3) component